MTFCSQLVTDSGMSVYRNSGIYTHTQNGFPSRERIKQINLAIGLFAAISIVMHIGSFEKSFFANGHQ